MNTTNKFITASCFLLFMVIIQISSQTRIAKSKVIKEVPIHYFSNTEHVFVQTDRDLYTAGENLFFKTYLSFFDSVTETKSNLCYLVLRDSKKIITKLLVKLESGSSFGSFYLADTLKTGMYELVAFTNYMRNFGESTYFRKNILIVNRFDKTLTELFELKPMFNTPLRPDSTHNGNLNHGETPFKLSIEKDSFRIREKIRIGIELTDSIYQNLAEIISISVKEMNPFTEYQVQNKRFIDSSKHTSYTGQRTSKITYLPEQNGMYLNGRFVKKDSSILANECLFLSTVDTVANLQYSFTDSAGNFTFFLNYYYLGKQLIIKPREYKAENSDARIELVNKFDLKDPFHPDFQNMTGKLRKYILSSQNLVQIQKMYSLKTIKTFDLPHFNFTIPFVYSQPSSVYFPADFVPLKNLEELSANILSGTKLKRDKTMNDLYVFNYLTNQYFESPSVVFLDGVPIDNVNQILDLGSSDINKVEVCKVPRIMGDIEFPGVVSILTTKKKINSLVFNPSTIKYNSLNFTGKSQYDPPVYMKASSSNPNPDFRQLLYWNPMAQLKPNEINYFEFTASDWFSDYIIEVTGISNDGKPLTTYAKIKIYL